MPIPPEEQEEAIKFYGKILKNAGITDEIKSVVASKSVLGPGGDAGGFHINLGENKEFVTIELNIAQDGGDETGEDKVKEEKSSVLELFLKKRPSAADKGVLFDREVFFYGVFLPDALSFTKEKDQFKEVELGNLFAKCYHADEDMILLENVIKRDLIMTPIDQPHTFLQAEMILENVGRFHAVTYAMIKTLGLEALKLKYSPLVKESVFSPGNAAQSTYWETTLEMALQVLKDSPVEGSNEGLQFLGKYKGKLFSELCDLVESRNEDVLTSLNFGDITNDNVFVKRDEEKQRYTAAVFIKPTMTRIGSPMLDVSSYMHSCVADHIRLTNYKYLLDVFFEFIRDKSRELGVDFEMDFEELKVLYIGKSCYGIFRAIDYLITKLYRKPLELTGDGFDFVKFESWLKENPERHNLLVQQIVSKIQQYEQCLQELAIDRGGQLE